MLPAIAGLASSSLQSVALTLIAHDLRLLSSTLRELNLATSVVETRVGNHVLLPTPAWPVLRTLNASVSVFRYMNEGSTAPRDAFPQLRSLRLGQRSTKRRVLAILPALPNLPCITHLTMNNVELPFTQLVHLAASSPHLAHLSILDCAFTDPAPTTPVRFPTLVKLVTRNNELDRLGSVMIMARLEHLSVDGFSPLSVDPWLSVSVLTIETDSAMVGPVRVSGAALDALPRLSSLTLPRLLSEWTDDHVPVLPHVTSLLAPMHVLSTVQAPKVVHVASPWFTSEYIEFTVPASARSVEIAVMHVELLAPLSRNANITHLVAREIVGDGEPVDVVTLEFRQGHPGLAPARARQHYDPCPAFEAACVHVVHVVDLRVAVRELT
ncbi:hypothetical protein AMAG_19197, partial [Allomyces macrogynus ATCC 38327]